ncbi:transposase [Hymenobacter sp. YC55]|uniref:transposase n=1 Tax=Hymenobacter sp. YC55 TaxID=3034019 RepID=UPI0023F6D1CD|nr:transposase [Hymenobacter sp. YC55]MDF7815372.1 transposase [Hymenobacter sp. YC55]
MNSKPTNSSPRKCRRYDDAFRAEALHLASESRSTQAAARQLGISPKLLYKWQKAEHPVLEVGVEESESLAMRQLRAENRRLQQERDILKKALAIFMPPTL